MRYGKMIIGFLTMILLVLVLLAGMQEEPAENMDVSLSFLIQSGQNTETVDCWEAPDGMFYVFLPGYAALEDVVAVPGDARIRIGDNDLTDNMSCGVFSLDRVYPFVYSKNGRKLEGSLLFVRSGSVPTLYMDVQSGNMDYIHMDKTHEESGTLRLYDADGKQLYSGIMAELKGRGNTSWYEDKKPYNFTLKKEADLLGMGAARRWILLSEGANVQAIRNKIVYDFAEKAGLPYSPDCEWVDLYLNGEYAGLYLLSERNEIHRERISIPEEGSFVISMESEADMTKQNLPYIALDSSQVFRVRYASMSDQDLAQIWQTLKNALLSEDGTDPVSGKNWQEFIDLDSWVRKYLIEEVFANADGGAVSQYFYMNGSDPQKKIAAGPVWDYDYAMGGEHFWMRNYPSFMILVREYTDDGLYLPWFYELYRKDVFYQRLTEVYENEFLPLLEELTETGIDHYAADISEASRTNAFRWDHSWEEVQEDTAFIKAFLQNRMDFLTDVWVNDTVYHIVRVNSGKHSSGYFAVKDGETLPELPSEEEREACWYYADTERPFDLKQPIYEDLSIFVKKAEQPIPRSHCLMMLGFMGILAMLGLYDGYRILKMKCRGNNSSGKDPE